MGLGTDIIEIDRIRKAIDEHGDTFLNRLFTEAERSYCARQADPARSYAGRFAEKEAIAKALGTGFGKELSWLDIEILPNELGAPIATLARRTESITLSIAHCRDYATAVAQASAPEG